MDRIDVLGVMLANAEAAAVGDFEGCAADLLDARAVVAELIGATDALLKAADKEGGTLGVDLSGRYQEGPLTRKLRAALARIEAPTTRAQRD